MSFSFAEPPKDIEEENSIAEHMFEETTDEEFGANEDMILTNMLKKYGSVEYKAYHRRRRKKIENAKKRGVTIGQLSDRKRGEQFTHKM